MAKRGASDAGLPDKPTSGPRAEAASSHRQLGARIFYLMDSVGDHRPAAPVSAFMDGLPPEMLKHILSLLDCQQLLKVKRVCRRWYNTATDIFEGATLRGMPRTHSQACRAMFGRLSKPTSNVQLQMMVLHVLEITELKLPERQRPLLDLNIVANTCRDLEKIDFGGFNMDADRLSIGKLAKRNTCLVDVTLPADCSSELRTLLLVLLSMGVRELTKLTVERPDQSGVWLMLLPKTLETLELTGLEVPLERWWPAEGMSDLDSLSLRDCSGVTGATLTRLAELAPNLGDLCLSGLEVPMERCDPDEGLSYLSKISFRGCSGVTDAGLTCLADLAPNLEYLTLVDCPRVTVDGLLHVSRLSGLKGLTLHGVPTGLITAAGQESPEDIGPWLHLLPENLTSLDISGLEAPLEQCWPPVRLPGLRHLYLRGCSGVTNRTLAWLPILAPQLETLLLADCRRVTDDGLLHVGRLSVLKELLLRCVPAGPRTAASAQDTARWLGRLSESLITLDISGIKDPVLQWRPDDRLLDDRHVLSVLIRHATDATLACLPRLASRLKCLYIADCPMVTDDGLLHVSRLSGLCRLSLHSVPASLSTDAEQDGPNNSRLWLQRLPQSLTSLIICGLEVPLERWEPEEGLLGLLSMSLRGSSGVTDGTLACLPKLAPNLRRLLLADCPGVTGSGLRHAGRLTGLMVIILLSGPAYYITDAMLDGLQDCSALQVLQMGDNWDPPEPAIPAAAVSRLAVACRRLRSVAIHSTTAVSRAVVDALQRTDLGSDRRGNPRTIALRLAGSGCWDVELDDLPDSRVYIEWWP